MSKSNDGVVTARRRSLNWRHLVMALWLAACGGALGSRTAGGESHFLRQCGDSCGAGLECISGVCTRGCLVAEDECTDLSPSAVCTDQSIEPGAFAVCDVSCENDANCAGLGANFECLSGFCRGPVLPGQEPTGGGSGGSGGGSGAGSGSGGQVPLGPTCTFRQGCDDPTAVCIDDADDECDSATSNDCPGTCQHVWATVECSGLASIGDLGRLAGGTPCPDGMACVRDLVASGRIPPGVCVEESVVGACSGPGECEEGFECTTGGELGDCAPKYANCWAPWLCPALVAPCSYGYARSSVGVTDGFAECAGPCVPVSRCGCTSNAECPEGALCDRRAGQCVALLPWEPPQECALPFDTGPCDAAVDVYAAVDGVCQPQVYGGCEGNANRFHSLAECLAVCEGRPLPHACPADRQQAIACIACAPIGGCAEWATVCAEPCVLDEDCQGSSDTCQEGVCQLLCIEG